MCLPTKLRLPISDPKKCYNPLSPPVLSTFISTTLFSVPEVENEVKRTPLCRCCWDPRSCNWWIKERPKRVIFSCFSETVLPCKSLYIYANGSYFELKKGYVSSSCLRFLKKSVLKLLDRTVYYHFASFGLNDSNIIECCLYLVSVSGFRNCCNGVGLCKGCRDWLLSYPILIKIWPILLLQPSLFTRVYDSILH